MRTAKKQRGANLVEAALTLLVLFFFIFGIIEFGRVYNIYQAITNASREGARFAVAPCPSLGSCSMKTPCNPNDAGTAGTAGVLPTNTEVHAAIRECLNSVSINTTVVPDGDIVVNQMTQNVAYGPATVPTTYTQVQITAHYRFLVFPFGNLPIRSRAVMRNETN